ncbi:MAG TPA: tetratricopeptide repeat protein [Bacteroidia bacterium]|nr:tetratricopeptide repeat protein [Bacteroidia bacterium]
MNRHIKKYCLFVFIVSSLSVFSQDDSLIAYFNKKNEIPNEKLAVFSKQLKEKDSLAIYHLASKIVTREKKVYFYHQVGKAFYEADNYENAKTYYAKALEMAKLTLDKQNIAKELSALGNIYRLQDKNTIALNLLFQAVYLYKELNQQKDLAFNLALIGDINRCIDQPQDALKYLNEALALSIKNNFQREEAFCYSSIGSVYQTLKKYDRGLTNYNEGLKIAQTIKDTSRIVDFLYSIGDLYIEQNRAEEALSYFNRAMEYDKLTGDQYNLALCYAGLGKVALKQKNPKKGVDYGLQAYEIGKLLTAPGICTDATEIIYQAYYEAGDYKNAFHYLKLKTELKDSTINLIQLKKQTQLEFNFVNSFKEKQDSIVRAEKQQQRDMVQATKSRQQEALVTAGAVAVITSILIIIVIFRSYRKERNSRQIINEQKLLVEGKNKEIMDSINYAKKIQQAIIPSSLEMANVFPQHFVLLLPKDIVSGDFYWVSSKLNYSFVAVADCTGHGVPGGFMSMLGTALLNEIINEKEVYEPADILDLLKFKIIMALRQSENVNEAKDGMDIALCRIDKTTNELIFAGANNSMQLLRNNKIIELKGDKQPIGISHFNITQQFIQQSISLQKNDLIYLFTDGYPDQFGGEVGKKFKYKQLEQLLLDIHNKDMQVQREILEKVHVNWKGSLSQVDDICILGIKI